MDILVAKRYAQAFFEMSLKSGHEDAAQRDFKKLLQWIEGSLDLRQFLDDPIMAMAERGDILEQIFKGRLHTETRHFIKYLNAKNRIGLLDRICRAYEDIYQKYKGIVEVTITSAMPLNKHQVHEITNHLKERLNKSIQLQLDVDPALIGGIKLQKYDMILDYSFKTQLEKFRAQVAGA